MPLVLIDISILLNILGFGQGLFLCLTLWKNRKIRSENSYLIVLLGAISLIILNSIFRLSYYVNDLDFYQDFSNSFLLLIAPSIYLFVTSKIEGSPIDTSIRHYLPFIVYFGFLIIHAFTIGLESEMKDNVSNVAFLLFNLQFIAYFGLSLNRLKGDTGKSGPLKWIKIAVWMILIPWVVQLSIIAVEVGNGIPVSDVISLNLALMFGVCAYFLSYKHASTGQSGFTQKEKYGTSRISTPELNRNMDSIRFILTVEKLYEDPEFSLNKLAEKTGLTPRVISLSINQSTNQNFVDFVNGYRVEAFKELIQQESAKNYTMVAIAEKCGFKSSSTFYAAFKKHTGMTPMQFKNGLT